MNTSHTCTTYKQFLTLLSDNEFWQIGLNPRKKVGVPCQIRIWTKNNMVKQLSVIVTEEMYTVFAAPCQHYLDCNETMSILEPYAIAEFKRKLMLLITD